MISENTSFDKGAAKVEGETAVVMITENRAGATSMKGKLTPVLWVHLKLFIQRLGAALLNMRKKPETNHFLSYLCD